MTRDSASPRLDRHALDLALKAAGLGEVEWRREDRVLTFNPRAQEILGLADARTSTAPEGAFFAAVHAEDRDRLRQAGAEVIEHGVTFDTEFRVTRPTDDRVVWVRVAGTPIVDKSGECAAVLAIVEDVSGRKLEESQRQTLMAELDHRVKNVLAAVQALAFQTAKRTTSLDGFLQTFAGRLKSMGSANELLTAARWRGAAVGHLAAAELGGLAPSQTRWDGPEIFLTPRAANAVSLALHELATNALKYGALSTDQGRVDVRWGRLDNGGFELLWVESGGPTVQPPDHRGFGSTLLDQVTGRELNGSTTLEYLPGGVRVRLRAAPTAVVERPETVPQAPPTRTVEAPAPVAGDADLGGSRILIVEDAVLLALELETGLQEAGAEVIGPAYELEEAMALLDERIDAAVLDANLNGRSVTPVAEVLAQRGVPFLFATGYGGAAGAPSGFDAPIIRKPYDVTQVAAAVSELLQRRRAGPR
ncbi:MAG: HWE histidine kinase domain-containing protein [Phenylobacterium sp.]|uniref:HWE histidine kinase domain-containing protein n=1 Tax=Phenylobacterium sp. TaxID=1871053 RepID=UPI00391D296B